MPSNPIAREWSSVREQFESLVRKRPDNIDDLLDAEVRKRFGQFITRATEREKRTKRRAKTF